MEGREKREINSEVEKFDADEKMLMSSQEADEDHGQEEDSESLGEGGGLQREISLPRSSQEAKGGKRFKVKNVPADIVSLDILRIW